jgi:Ca2+/H+ antiporter
LANPILSDSPGKPPPSTFNYRWDTSRRAGESIAAFGKSVARSVLASSLTIPAVLATGLLTDQRIVLGLDPVDTILLVLTLGLATLTFASARTNVLRGAVHLLLFLAYLMLIFEK